MSETELTSQVTVGRYVLHRQLARGGMATIHIARLMGDEGFSRIVAAKRLLPELAEDSEFVAMFMDEARIASKVHHRNVVPVLDLVTTSDDVMLVQEYVHGVPLHTILRTARQHKQHIPVRVAVSIATQELEGKANRQSDSFALAVVLWELIVGHRLHGSAQGEAERVATVMSGKL